MTETELKVRGLAELNQFLQQLPANVERNVLRGALREGMKPIQQDAVANVPVATGELRDGLVVSTRVRGGRVTASLKAKGKHAFLAYWLEFTGAAQHIIKAKNAGFLFFGDGFARKVTHPGFAAKPFMRPALQARAQDAVVATGNYIKRRLATKEGLTAAADVNVEATE